MESHIDDAENVLGMPVVFAEFGVSAKDKNFSVSFRDQFIDVVYKSILNSTRKGGSGGGSLLWQLFPEGTDYMDDGYEVVLKHSIFAIKEDTDVQFKVLMEVPLGLQEEGDLWILCLILSIINSD